MARSPMNAGFLICVYLRFVAWVLHGARQYHWGKFINFSVHILPNRKGERDRRKKKKKKKKKKTRKRKKIPQNKKEKAPEEKRKNIGGGKGGRGGGVGRTSRCKLLHLERINNVLLYNTRN